MFFECAFYVSLCLGENFSLSLFMSRPSSSVDFRVRSKTLKPRRISFPRFFTLSFSFGTIPKTDSELKTLEFSPRHFDQTQSFPFCTILKPETSEELKTSEFSSYAL